MTNFCPCTGPLVPYEYSQRLPAKLQKIDVKEISDWRETWHNLRVATSGQKRVKDEAYKLEWLELPEHIQYKMAQTKDLAHQRLAEKSAKAYYARTPFDESVSVAKSITLGAVFRIDTIREGLADNQFTINDLDAAEIAHKNWGETERFVLDERLTTGFMASYVFLRDQGGEQIATVKHYCAENIVDLCYDSMGNLEFILFREAIDKNSQDRFSEDEAGYIFRELSLDDGVFIERTWRSEDGDIEADYEVDESDETLVTVRGATLRELPVIIIGGPYPSSPPFAALFEKTRELFQVSAQIKYREHKISHPTLHINYEDGPNMSYVCSGEERGAGVVDGALHDDDLGPNDPPAIVPGLALETQKASVNYLYDTGEGLTFLFDERNACQEDLERLGGNYGITKTASNVSEAVERMRQGREAAFITNYVLEASEALTRIAQWIAFFSGIDNEERLNEISIKLNTVLSDQGPEYTLTDVRDLLISGAIDHVIAIRMMQALLPDEVFGEGLSAEDILARINAEQFGLTDNPLDMGGISAGAQLGVPSGDESLARTSLNGAQVTTIAGLVVSVANGEIPEATAITLIENSFPSIARQSIIDMFTPLSGFNPSQPDAR